MPYIERKIKSGKLLEREIYFSTRYGQKLPRGYNEGKTPEDMEKINERNSQRKLMRLILCNFSREQGDVFVTFTYGEAVTEEEARKGERNLMARLKRMREKKGLEELKYIVITEKQGRWHHHVIMNGGLTQEDLHRAWGGRGQRISMSVIDDSYSYEDLSKYLTQKHKPKKGDKDGENRKQGRRKGERRWHGSRNLNKPIETKRIIKRMTKAGEPKAPKGYRLLPNWYFGCDIYGYIYQYASYVETGEHHERKAGARAAGANKRGSVLSAGAVSPVGKGGRSRSDCKGSEGKDVRRDKAKRV